jgi:U3 small nucleolar RNA-associated protein 12
MIYPLSRLPLPSRNWVSQIALYPNQPYLAVQSHDRSVEIPHDEVRKKQVRRQKREKEKGEGEGKSKKGKEN